MGARERSPALELAKEIAAAKLRDLEAARTALRERHRAIDIDAPRKKADYDRAAEEAKK